MSSLTPEELWWSGKAGDAYTGRNTGRVMANTAFFARALKRTHGVTSILELGCGAGENLVAINRLLPDVKLWGVEVNESAAAQVPFGNVIRGSILTVELPIVRLSFSKGCLIHIAPEDLPRAYERLYDASSRYILVCEYHNPVPVMVEYRGEMGKLWKRDFAGEILDKYQNLRIVDYGFAWKRDPNFGQDDIFWCLCEKT